MEEELNYEQIFGELEREFDDLDKRREKILPIVRNIIRDCGEVIRNIHYGKLEGLEEVLEDIKRRLGEIAEDIEIIAGITGKNYITVAKQEYTEAALLYYLVVRKKIVTYKDLGVNPYEYVLGLADLIGELRRMVLDRIRKGDYKRAEFIYGIMNDLYFRLFSLNYPSGLLPNLRHKVDTARNIVVKTQEVITTAVLAERIRKGAGVPVSSESSGTEGIDYKE